MDILGPTLSNLEIAIEGKCIEVIVVDDTADGRLRQSDVGSFLLLKSRGLGASTARNVGWRHSGSELLLFLDDDILISRSSIDRTLELHREKGKSGFNYFWEYPEALKKELHNSKFGKYILKHGLYSNKHRLREIGNLNVKRVRMTGLTSQYFSIEKKWIEQVGGYDSIPFAGIEDLLLFKKLDQAGVQIFLLPDEIVFQNESNRISSESLYRRYRTGALTRRVAVNMGHPEMGISFSAFGRIKGRLGLMVDPLLKKMETLLPYGVFYDKIVNYRLFISSYKGYLLDPNPLESSKKRE